MNRQTQWIFFDNYRRKLLIKHELKSVLLKTLEKNKKKNKLKTTLISLNKSLLVNLSSKNKLSNRCIISGRNRNVLNKTKTSRFNFRKYVNDSVLPGLTRYSK